MNEDKRNEHEHDCSSVGCQMGPEAHAAMHGMLDAVEPVLNKIGPAEKAALEKLDALCACEPAAAGIISTMLGMAVGFYASRGATPEEIGDAATGMARMLMR